MTPLYFSVSIDGNSDNDSHVELIYQQLELIERFAGVPILWEGYGVGVDPPCYDIKLTLDIKLKTLINRIKKGVRKWDLDVVEAKKVFDHIEDMELTFNRLKRVNRNI